MVRLLATALILLAPLLSRAAPVEISLTGLGVSCSGGLACSGGASALHLGGTLQADMGADLALTHIYGSISFQTIGSGPTGSLDVTGGSIDLHGDGGAPSLFSLADGHTLYFVPRRQHARSGLEPCAPQLARRWFRRRGATDPSLRWLDRSARADFVRAARRRRSARRQRRPQASVAPEQATGRAPFHRTIGPVDRRWAQRAAGERSSRLRQRDFVNALGVLEQHLALHARVERTQCGAHVVLNPRVETRGMREVGLEHDVVGA
jgi:hypothetical protein